jgi:Icc-related predicted phosphoesterase
MLMAGKLTKIFFATDIHGSEACFLKFANAGKFYNVDALIMGGDITGKVIVPICRKNNGVYETEFMGSFVKVADEKALSELVKRVRSIGFYPYVTDEDEVAELRDNPRKLDELFSRMMRDTLARWMKEAETRLEGTQVSCFISPGNDDLLGIEDILSSSKRIRCPEGETVHVTEDIEMISTGFANLTPWACPRDISEEELRAKIEGMASKVENMKRCIFNLHAPPYGSGLDSAPELDSTLKPVTKAGTVVIASVGSKAVRESIEKFQPMIGLHGHIHESRSVCKIGRTLCYNPGSEYTEGILRGVIITMDQKGVKNDFFISG